MSHHCRVSLVCQCQHGGCERATYLCHINTPEHAYAALVMWVESNGDLLGTVVITNRSWACWVSSVLRVLPHICMGMQVPQYGKYRIHNPCPWVPNPWPAWVSLTHAFHWVCSCSTLLPLSGPPVSLDISMFNSRPSSSGKINFTIRAIIVLYNIIDASIMSIASWDKPTI